MCSLYLTPHLPHWRKDNVTSEAAGDGAIAVPTVALKTLTSNRTFPESWQSRMAFPAVYPILRVLSPPLALVTVSIFPTYGCHHFDWLVTLLWDELLVRLFLPLNFFTTLCVLRIQIMWFPDALFFGVEENSDHVLCCVFSADVWFFWILSDWMHACRWLAWVAIHLEAFSRLPAPSRKPSFSDAATGMCPRPTSDSRVYF